jgi:hypothetical protein
MPVGQDNEALPFVSVGAKFFHMLEIHDRRAMDPQENLGIQFSLEISHGVAQHVTLFAGADSHVIFFRPDPTDIGNG